MLYNEGFLGRVFSLSELRVKNQPLEVLIEVRFGDVQLKVKKVEEQMLVLVGGFQVKEAQFFNKVDVPKVSVVYILERGEHGNVQDGPPVVWSNLEKWSQRFEREHIRS